MFAYVALLGVVFDPSLFIESCIALSTNKYEEKVALKYLQYARAAFCTKSAIESWSCGEMCEDVPVVQGSVRFVSPTESRYAVQGFVARVPGNTHADDARCVVAFRGSVAFMNWIEDFGYFSGNWPMGDTARAAWCEGCMVHDGFAGAFASLKDNMTNHLRDLACTDVMVAGHSLGGAIATLATIYIREELNIRVGTTYTFGKPRLGNYAFVKAFIESAQKAAVQPPLWRIVHYKDIVPRVPCPKDALSPIWRFEYAHEPEEVYYSTRASESYEECSTPPVTNAFENPTCSWTTPLAGCLNSDHVTYLNKSLRTKGLPKECFTDAENVLLA